MFLKSGRCERLAANPCRLFGRNVTLPMTVKSDTLNACCIRSGFMVSLRSRHISLFRGMLTREKIAHRFRPMVGRNRRTRDFAPP